MTSLREQFPSLKTGAYLNTAGGGPIPQSVYEASTRYYRETLEDGDVHWNAWMERVESARSEIGQLVGASPEQVAFVGNASVGLNIAAALAEPGSIAFARSEFPSCTLPWLRRGFRPMVWDVAEDGSFTIDDIAGALSGDTTAVMISWVQYQSGFRADLAAISALCRSRGIALVVDGTQGVGAFPIDASDLDLDALVFSGYKWMTSGYGVAGLVLPKGLPEAGSPIAGWRSQDQPYELEAMELRAETQGRGAEAGHPPFPNVFALGAGSRLWNAQGPGHTSEEILTLVRAVHQDAERLGLTVLSPTSAANQSGIVMLEVPEPGETARLLAERHILTSARGRGLRISVHAYNSPEDVELLFGALDEILPGFGERG